MKNIIKIAGSALYALFSRIEGSSEGETDTGVFAGPDPRPSWEIYDTPLTGPECGIPQKVIDRQRELEKAGIFAL